MLGFLTVTMRKPLIVNIINTDDNSCKLVTIDISNNDANMTYARLLEQYDNRNFCNFIQAVEILHPVRGRMSVSPFSHLTAIYQFNIDEIFYYVKQAVRIGNEVCIYY
jgi:hypothetical protein